MLSLILSRNFSFAEIVIRLLSSCAVVFLTMPVHEAAHAFVAVKLGDPTPRYQGRLTLNPFAHIDYFGALCIILFGFGWAKPVSVNMRNFDEPKKDMALTALAGPASNLIMAFALTFLSNFFIFVYFKTGLFFISYVVFFLNYAAYLNITLAIFNFIPIPPLDGSRLLFAFLPDSVYYRIMRYERVLIIIVLVLCYTGIIGGPLSLVSNNIYTFFNHITGLIFGIGGA